MRVIAYASLNDVDFTRAVAAKALSNVFTDTEVQVEMADILEAVAAHYGVAVEALKSQGRLREVVVPRQVAMYLIRELTSHSLPEIGQFFGRDHSTVLYAIQKVSEQVERDADLASATRDIRGRLG